MKKPIILMAALLLATVTVYAQTEKGNQTLGFNLSFTYNQTSGISINPYDNSSYNAGTKYTVFNLGPSYSYFISDKLDFGAALSYMQTTNNYPASNSSEKQSTNSYGGNIFLRKYFMFGDKIGLRAGPYVGYFRGTNKVTYNPANAINDNNAKTDYFSGGVNAELVYYPSKHFGLSASLASLNYSHYKTDAGTQGHTQGDNFNAAFINNGLSLSAFYVFGGK